MNRRKHFLVGLIALTVAVVSAALPAADYKTPLGTPELKPGDCIVFLGDSITHQCLYTQYVEDYFYTRFPKMRLKFHNAGVGGAKAWDALERFDRDVAAYKPKYVTLLLGMNDGLYQPYSEETFQTYRKDMTELLARLRTIGATPILMTPTMYDARAARMTSRKRSPEGVELYNSVLAYFGAWLREVAVESGDGFVDMYSLLNNLTLGQRKTDPKFTLIPGAVHPDPSGQLVMAYAMLSDLGFQRFVSNIRIVLAADGKVQGRATGGKISALKSTGDGVSFTWLADSLPFVVPEEAQLGAKLLKLGHRMSREALEVHGLPAGRYTVSIDGQLVGVYLREALDRHVELEENTKTPQHSQALEVAELNKQRNAGPVHALRGEWLQFQSFSRLRAQLKGAPENEALKKQFEARQKKLEGMEERIAEHEQAAKALEDKIFTVNQPKPRTYVVKRILRSKTTGKVTVNGKPLAGATITFRGENGFMGRGKTSAEGRYVVRSAGAGGLVPGRYRVTISNSKLPAKYADPKRTGLTAEIKPGENTMDFDLRKE